MENLSILLLLGSEYSRGIRNLLLGQVLPIYRNLLLFFFPFHTFPPVNMENLSILLLLGSEHSWGIRNLLLGQVLPIYRNLLLFFFPFHTFPPVNMENVSILLLLVLNIPEESGTFSLVRYYPFIGTCSCRVAR
jgi:hypothetical protein